MPVSSPTGFSYITLDGDSDPNTVLSTGGIVETFVANSTTLLVGDIVYLQGANGVVDKSATAANYVGFVGVVVGGASTDFELNRAVGITAATSGQQVVVQLNGIANCIVGATGFTVGTNWGVVPSAATAGRVIPGTTQGQMIGTCLSTQATAGSAVLVLIRHR